MSKPIAFTQGLSSEYAELFGSSTVRPEKKTEINNVVSKIVSAWGRYQSVGKAVGCPAHLVALIHTMECGLSFDRHLHNGDPLTSRTTHVPAGRPTKGKPPFSWEESAVDALTEHGIGAWSDWSVPGLCYILERYNGFGYRNNHPDVKSPYLWSYTTAYTSGKYVADGSFDRNAVSKQPGAIAIFKTLIQLKPYNPVASSHPYGGKLLKQGSTGEAVKQVQDRLVQLGCLSQGIEPAGTFGPLTANGVIVFQNKSGLAIDGKVGPDTWAALFKDAN